MTSPPAPAETSNPRNLIAACAAICVAGFAFGMTYPLLSLILEGRGVSPNMIGINAAMTPIGILLSAPVIPIAARRFGGRAMAIMAAVVTAVLVLGYKAFPSLEAWFLLRLLQGMTISILFVLSEAWIVKFADHKSRGRTVAIYGSVLSASFGAGPAVIGWIGIEGWAPFVIGAGVLLACIVPLTLVRDDEEADPAETTPSSFFTIAAKAPMLLAAVGLFAVFDAATLSLIPVYGIRMGLDVTTAATALTALIAGNVVLQFPIGWLADIFPKRSVLAGCAAVTLAALLLLPQVMGGLWMWPVLVVAGSTGYGMYAVSLAALGDRFRGQELVAGMAAFATVWGIGALAGSVAGGWAMEGFGPHGLPYVLALAFALYLAGLAARGATLLKTN